MRDLNPQLVRRAPDYGCPHGLCDGTGFVLDEQSNVARPCRCRPGRIANARARRLRNEIPERYQDVAFDRNPVPDILRSLGPVVAREVHQFCDRIDAKLDAGEGMWFMGPRGTGKTTLAMLISVHAMRARRAVGVYTAPQLLNDIYATYRKDSPTDSGELIERLLAVDLLHLEDLAVVRPTDWVLETFYTVVNDRYQGRRSIVFTADVSSPDKLAEHVGERTFSRLMQMCGDPIPMFGEDHRLSYHA